MVPGFRIGCMGAGGTGKTTTADSLADTFELVRLRSASRQVYEAENLTEDLVLEMSEESKWELQSRIFAKKIDMDDNTASFVADRTLLDHWAYCLMYCGADMSNEEFKKYETLVRKHMLSTYSILFYFAWGYWDVKNKDGVRSDKDAWQSAIDAIIVGYCVRWNLPVINLPQSSGEDYRYEFANNVIRKRLGLDQTNVQ
jgi:hypothetical protein